MNVVHRIAARRAEKTLTRCGLELGPAEGTAWSSETTCDACEDPATPWPFADAQAEKDWFKPLRPTRTM